MDLKFGRQSKENIRIMEMKGVCFRRFVTGLKIGGRKRNEDVRKGLLITRINAKMEILKGIFREFWKN
jgi:hypothetical protein